MLIGALGTTPDYNDPAQLRSLYEASVAKQGSCSGQDCSKDQYRIPYPGIYPWWPAGTVYVWGPYFTEGGVMLPLTTFFDDAGKLRSYIEYPIPRSAIGPQNYAAMAKKWSTLSKERFDNLAREHRSLSLNAFVQKYPEFKEQVQDMRVKILPSSSEKTGSGGLTKFRERGGYLLSARVVEGGIVPFEHVEARLDACLQWCRGCVTSYYKQGVPTCSDKVDLSNGFRWDLHLLHKGGTIYAIIKRLNRSGWESAVAFLDRNYRRITNAICENYQLAAIAAPAKNPSAVASTTLVSQNLQKVCSSGSRAPKPVLTVTPLPVTTLPVTPPAPPPLPEAPPKWYQTTPGKVGIAVGVSTAAGVALWLLLANR